MTHCLISVIVVTYNPRSDLLDWALNSLENQTLPKSSFEVIVVDNNSNPPLQRQNLMGGRTLDIKLIQEPRQGIIFARSAGITKSRSDLLVFVDDDNYLDPDYLEQALNISREYQNIGAFGGIVRAVFEGPVRHWQKKFLPQLGVRDHGPDPITSSVHQWGVWYPIGAGMVLRRAIGRRFVEFAEISPYCRMLGRSGKSLMSGDDTLIARIANEMGYACSYQPKLKLSHHIKKGRLKFNNLAKTIEGHGRSFVVLQHIWEQDIERPSAFAAYSILLAKLLYRITVKGLIVGFLESCYDVGYIAEAREEIYRQKTL